jgi:hypothetical protein
LLQIPQLSRVIVGVESVDQLVDIFNDFPETLQLDYGEFHTDDVRVLDPSTWGD